MDPRYPTGRFEFDPQPSPDKRQIAVAAIGSFPAELGAVMPSVRLDRPYREGGWTARQVIHHLADSHMNAFLRMRWTLTEDDTVLKPYDESAWLRLADAAEDPSPSVRILEGVHHRMHAMLRSLPDTAFARTATHPERGKVSLDWLLQLYAWHGRHHIGHLRLTAL